MTPIAKTFVVAAILAAAPMSASGPVGLYGVVDKVVFEPDEKMPERIQVWGAFAYADGAGGQATEFSPVKRGYVYFKVPTVTQGFISARELENVRREWADLKSVAGTGQAVAFGTWGYIGAFRGLRPDINSDDPPYVIERAPGGGALTDLRVRPASEPPRSPATYQTNAGIVKLSDQGSHAAIVKALKDALR